jgi:hypothetical protein
MKSIVGLFRRGDDHKIKKNQAVKPLKPHQLRFKIIRAKSEISNLTSEFDHIDTSYLKKLSPQDQKWMNKLAVAQIKLSRFEKELTGVLERREAAKKEEIAKIVREEKPWQDTAGEWIGGAFVAFLLTCGAIDLLVMIQECRECNCKRREEWRRERMEDWDGW